MTIRCPTAIFYGRPQAPCQQVIAEAWYGKDTAIHKALLQPEVANYAKTLPFLKEITIEYTTILDRWRPDIPWGFGIRPTLRKAVDDDSEEACQYVTITSGLDPVDFAPGSGFTPAPFISADTLGEIRSWGSSSASHGSGVFLDLSVAQGTVATPDNDEGETVYGAGDLKNLAPDSKAVTAMTNKFSDDDFAPLAQRTGLETLNLYRCNNLSGECFKHISNLPHLKKLTLDAANMDGANFDLLGKLPIEALEIYGAQSLDPKHYRQLFKLSGLKKLCLSRATNLHDSDFESLCQLQSLDELELSDTKKITLRGFRHIEKLQRLRAITIWECLPSGSTAYLAHLKNLESASFYRIPLNDKDMEFFAKISSLKKISLSTAAITDSGLERLASLPNLARVRVTGCKSLTQKGVDEFQRKQPRLKQFHHPDQNMP